MEDRQTLGRMGEEAAVRYFRRKRYVIIARRFRLLRGEIDIIARHGETIVFAEVKTRTGRGYGPPEEAVTAAKQAQIRKIAEGYLLKHRIPEVPCRFDVVSVLVAGGRASVVDHIQDAF
jgi:putative endonuclease